LKNIETNDDHGTPGATSEIPLVTKSVEHIISAAQPLIGSHRLQIHHTFAAGRYQALQVTPTSEVLVTKVGRSGRREIKLIFGDPQIANESKLRSAKIWETLRRSKQDSGAKIRLSSVLPLELDMIILGYGKSYSERCGS
jgi:hypothetical protein